MAKKQITKADLEARNESLAREIEEYVTKIGRLEKEIIYIKDTAEKRYGELLEQISLALKDGHIEFEHQPFQKFEFGRINLEKLQSMTVTEIFFKIGRLTHIAKEYEELKDRSLPLPKLKILEQENRDRNYKDGYDPRRSN